MAMAPKKPTVKPKATTTKPATKPAKPAVKPKAPAKPKQYKDATDRPGFQYGKGTI